MKIQKIWTRYWAETLKASLENIYPEWEHLHEIKVAFYESILYPSVNYT